MRQKYLVIPANGIPSRASFNLNSFISIRGMLQLCVSVALQRF